ncbi:unnamed protein product [Victoria cruziana]
MLPDEVLVGGLGTVAGTICGGEVAVAANDVGDHSVESVSPALIAGAASGSSRPSPASRQPEAPEFGRRGSHFLSRPFSATVSFRPPQLSELKHRHPSARRAVAESPIEANLRNLVKEKIDTVFTLQSVQLSDEYLLLRRLATAEKFKHTGHFTVNFEEMTNSGRQTSWWL